jgi:hypothetical protein
VTFAGVIGLWALVLLTVPAPAWAQESRETGPSSGRRQLLEEAERARQQRQRWDAEEEEARRRAKQRQRTREEYIQQRRQPEPTPTLDTLVVP